MHVRFEVQGLRFNFQGSGSIIKVQDFRLRAWVSDLGSEVAHSQRLHFGDCRYCSRAHVS